VTEHKVTPPPKQASSHEHGHSHEHLRADEQAALDPPRLAEGAGIGKWLFFDAYSGIAGDMTIAALVDLGVPFEVVEAAIGALPIAGYELACERSRAGAIGARQFHVRVQHQDRERTYAEIDELIASAPLAAAVQTLARRIFRRLAEAESRVHRISLKAVHFHEVGAVDAIVDVVGSAACLCYLGARVVASPLPLGRGFVQCRHGVLPLPAPATVECLRGVPTLDAGIDAELVTPTGAAIIATVADRFERWPSMVIERVGWGSGVQQLPDRPNALRVVLAEAIAPDAQASGTHTVLEANIDDMTGELAGHVIDMLLRAGALDAWTTPITMKKGRPGLIVAALVDTMASGRLAEVLLRETSSIGVRRTLVHRTERPRRVISVQTRFGEIPVKVSEGPYGPPQLKPEFEACVRAADAAGVPVKQVLAEALRVALELNLG
jgi:hypothetical protein